MGLKVVDMGIVNEWKGTLKEFAAACKKPGAGAPSENPEVLSKWLVTSMYLTILSSLITIGYAFVPDSGYQLSAGIQNFVVTVIYSFIYTWITWFAFVKREPACCCLCVCCFDGDSWIFPVVGGLTALGGLLGLLSTLANIMNILAYPGLYMIVALVYTVIYALYCVCLIAIGVCIFKRGGGKKGAEAAANAAAEKVGA